MNLKEQYDRIFKYLYSRLHNKQEAEDLTQETFLRFLESRTYQNENRELQYLYTIARNLCSQYYRDRTPAYSLDAPIDALPGENFELPLLQKMALLDALESLSEEEREMLFLRYVNDVPVAVMSGIYHQSRFAVYRKIKAILKKLRIEMEKEDRNE